MPSKILVQYWRQLLPNMHLLAEELLPQCVRPEPGWIQLQRSIGFNMGRLPAGYGIESHNQHVVRLNLHLLVSHTYHPSQSTIDVHLQTHKSQQAGQVSRCPQDRS